MRRFVIGLLVFLMILVTMDWGYCGESETSEPVFAIQEKIFFKYHELTLVTGYISNDDFHEVFPVGIAYTYNFNDTFSWEVLRGYYDFTIEKDLMDDLLNQFAASPVEIYRPQAQLLSHIVFRPLYGKDAVLNKTIINHETYFYAGGGIDIYKKEYPDSAAGSASDEMAMCVSFGTGIKYFINESVNMAFEIRDLVSFRENEIENRLWFGVNFGFRFNFKARKSYSDETLNSLKRFLKDNE